MSIDPKELRKQFDSKVRRQYFKEHPEVCKKCGAYERKVHLHHKVPLLAGGTNDFDNLIPLCDGCHSDWHCIEGAITLDEFMEIPSYREIMIFYKRIQKLPRYDLIENSTFGEALEELKEMFNTVRKLRKQFGEMKHHDEKWKKEMEKKVKNGVQLSMDFFQNEKGK